MATALENMAIVASTIIKPGEGILLRTSERITRQEAADIRAHFEAAGFKNPLMILDGGWEVTSMEEAAGRVCICDGGSFEVKSHPFLVNPKCRIHNGLPAN